MTRQCGECSLCCKVFDDIKDAPEKRRGGWCSQCDPGGVGCKIYDTRPQVCRNFECVWVQHDKGLPDWLKPSRSRVVVNSSTGLDLMLHPDPSMPDAWRRPDVLGYFMDLASKGITVAVVEPRGRYYQILPRGPIPVDGYRKADGVHVVRTMHVFEPTSL